MLICKYLACLFFLFICSYNQIAVTAEYVDHEMVEILKQSTIEEFNKVYCEASKLIEKLTTITGITEEREQLITARNNFNTFARKVSLSSTHTVINANLEYMQTQLKTVQSIRDFLSSCTTPTIAPTTTTSVQQIIPRALSEQILDTSHIRLESLPIGKSVQLINNKKVVGFVRKFRKGVVIELKGTSQTFDMECGVSTYANASILRGATHYPQIMHDLHSKEYREKFSRLLKTKVLEQLTHLLGSGAAEEQWHFMMKSSGLSLDNLYQIATSDNIFLGADDARMFKMFPDTKDVSNLIYAKKQSYLLYSFYKDVKKIDPTAQAQQFSIPSTCAVLTGSNIEKIGHWIAVRIELMCNGQISIIFVDSCPFARDGDRVELIDKIETYEHIFDGWFTNIPSYMSK